MGCPIERKWREVLKKKLIAAGLWKEFNDRRREIEKEKGVWPYTAWKLASQEFPVLPWREFAEDYKEKRKNRHPLHNKKAVVKNLKLPQSKSEVVKIVRAAGREIRQVEKEEKEMGRPTNAEREAREKLKKKASESIKNMLPKVKVEDDGTIDILRDTKWVYYNMSRLFIVDLATGVEKLDEKVLLESPSNGAIGLAYYALKDKEKFFEKFVIKILPKDEAAEEPTVSEEDLIAEHDPSFDDLERYMKKIPR